MFRFKFVFLVLVLSFLFFISGSKFFKANTFNDKKVVAITQIVPHPSLDRIRQGIEKEIKANFGDSVIIKFQSAQGNATVATQIAQNFIGSNVDVLVTITTPSSQAALSVENNNIPLVFVGVTDPLAAKLINSDGTLKNNITGVSDAPDIKAQVKLVAESLPKGSVIGIIYNPGETNSYVHVERLEDCLNENGFKLIKVPAYCTGDVLQASQNVVSNVDAIMLTNDNTVISALDVILKIAEVKKVPVFCSDPESVKRGCKACVAPDQYEMGIEAGKMVVEILNGEKVSNLKVVNMPSKKFELNMKS